MEIWVVYGLVLLFFILFFLVVVFSLYEPKPALSRQHEAANIVHDKISYTLLLIAFALIILLTLAAQRERS